MFNIAICDTDKVFMDYTDKQIKDIINKLTINDIYIEKFSNGNDFLSKYLDDINFFNIIFLEIDLLEMNGFEVADLIKKDNEELIIVFLTSMENLVYESFKHGAFRFIRKRRIKQELYEVICSAINIIQCTKVSQYKFKIEEGEIKLCSIKILYVECLNRKIYIKTLYKTYRILGFSFTNVVNEFLQNDFILINRSCIVNLKYISCIRKSDIILDNEEILSVSRYKLNDVRKAFMLFKK